MKAIPKAEFARRRRKLMDQMAPGSIAVIPSAKMMVRNRDVEHFFRQESDFYYLTGFDEPDACLVLVPGREQGEVILFCRERERNVEIWHGLMHGPEGAVAKFGADDGFPITDIDDIITGLIEGRSRIYTNIGMDPAFDRQVMDWVNQIRANESTGGRPPEDFSDLSHLLHDMRLIKSKAEINMMRRAAEITAKAHTRAMTFAKPGQWEYELEAEINHEFMRSGSRRSAYCAIVAAGNNACTLHYLENNQKIKAGDLVMIDAGCEFGYYASDVSRTFPASGRFSQEQQLLYQMVLDAQYAAIAVVKPGNTFDNPHQAALRVIVTGLVDLGILAGDIDDLLAAKAYQELYMHRTGHWLGMDVHDVGDYKLGGEWRVLEPGMTLTIEPGIYIDAENDKVAKKWRGIGIRIEDDILVTKDGCEVLSKDVVKEISDIEALMNGGQASLF